MRQGKQTALWIAKVYPVFFLIFSIQKDCLNKTADLIIEWSYCSQWFHSPTNVRQPKEGSELTDSFFWKSVLAFLSSFPSMEIFNWTMGTLHDSAESLSKNSECHPNTYLWWCVCFFFRDLYFRISTNTSLPNWIM